MSALSDQKKSELRTLTASMVEVWKGMEKFTKAELAFMLSVVAAILNNEAQREVKHRRTK